MNRIIENREYDVVVAGGGTAGIAAALAAARQGAKTVLLEKEYCLGGLATLGLIVIYLPLCDGEGVQLSAGIAEELLRLSCGLSDVKVPAAWDDPGATAAERKACGRFRVTFKPASFMILAEKLLRENGVEILYDARLTDAVTKDGKVASVVVPTKTGSCVIRGKAFVDCTGDSDLCYFTGEDTFDNPFNVRTGWYFSDGADGVQLHGLSDPLLFDKPKEGMPLYRGTTLGDVSRHMEDMHDFIRADVEKRRESDPTAYPLMMPSFHGLRMTRRLAGVFEFCEPAHDHVWFDDAVGMIGNWRKAGPRYAVPFRCLHAAVNDNLYAAGRCSAADLLGWDLLRVIPSCAVTGEAAGTAAAMQAKTGEVPEIAALQTVLKNAGVILDPSLLK